MRLTTVLILVICFLGHPLFAQNKFDSLRANAVKAISDRQKGVAVEELCFQLFIAFWQDSLPAYNTALQKIALRLNDQRFTALSKFYESQSFYRGDTVQFFAFAREAEALSKEAKCEECLALNCLGLGIKYRNLKQYDNAIEKLSESILLLNDVHHKRVNTMKSTANITLSAVYHYKSKYSEALNHGLQGLKLAVQLNDLYLIQRAYNSLSAVYGELYSPDNNLGTEADREHYKLLAKYYMRKTYESSLGVSSKRSSAVAAYNLGFFFSEDKIFDSSAYFLNRAIKLGEESNYTELLSNAYHVKGSDYANANPDSALYFFEKAIHYAQESDFVSNEASAMISKARILQKRQQHVQAMQLAEEALNRSLQGDVRTTTMDAYKLLADLCEEDNNKMLAYDYFKKHIALKDSIVSGENFRRIEELKARYDSEVKDNEIKNLSQTASIQALEITQRNSMLISLLIFIGLAVVAGVFFFRQRTMAQQQKQLQLENRFLRFQLNPHFLSNALVSIQRFLFESNASMAADYLARFSRLMRQFLEYSRKDIIPIEDEVEVLRNYFEIQKLSFQNGFVYDIQVDEDLYTSSDKIPPMFAQPFVENALEHGIKGMKDGVINVRFEKINDFVRMIITDNGKGLKDSVNKTPHASLATTIIQERIALLNKSSKEKIEMSITSGENGQGTRVEIRLPIYS